MMKIPNGKHRVAIHLDPATIATAGITADGYGAGAAIRRYCVQLELAAESVENKFGPDVWRVLLNSIEEQTLATMEQSRKTPVELILADVLAHYPKADQKADWPKLKNMGQMEAEAVLVAVQYYHLNKKAISLDKSPNWYTVAFRRRRDELVK